VRVVVVVVVFVVVPNSECMFFGLDKSNSTRLMMIKMMLSGHVRHQRRKVTGGCRHHRPGLGARSREEHGVIRWRIALLQKNTSLQMPLNREK
jgi:hypothetical protein